MRPNPRRRHRRLSCELLEPRCLLAGVTLITHGFNASVSDWVTTMAGAIRARPDLALDQPRYRIEVTDSGHDGGPLSVVGARLNGPSPTDCAISPEIVVLLNWTDVAGTLAIGGGYHRSTVDVAAAVAEKLVLPNFLPDLATPLAELPLHLIGHSRGASLVGELAKDLGAKGVWVDQVTTLDPHPVDGVREPTLFNYNFGDAAMTGWRNVVFWDNYWRTEGSGSVDFTGESIDNVYNLQLSETVLTSGGYGYEHSDVHLWYHGTIDTSPSASDGTYPVPTAWYGGPHPARDASGYYYSRVVGGTRAALGLSQELGGSAVRADLNWTSAVWPNIMCLRMDSPNSQVAAGEPIRVTYWYQDCDSSATTTFYLDPDENPYNGNQIETDQKLEPQTAAAPSAAVQYVQTTNPQIVLGRPYHIYAKISDGPYTRYDYAPGQVTVSGRIQGTVGDDSIHIVRDATDAGTAEVRVNNPGPVPTYSADLAGLAQWQVAGGAGNDVLTVDFSRGDPLPAGGLDYDGGGHVAGDRFVVRGTSGSDSVRVTANQVLVNSAAALSYRNVEAFGFDLGAGGNSLTVESGTVRIDRADGLTAGITLSIGEGGTVVLSSGLEVTSALGNSTLARSSAAPAATTGDQEAWDAVAVTRALNELADDLGWLALVLKCPKGPANELAGDCPNFPRTVAQRWSTKMGLSPSEKRQ